MADFVPPQALMNITGMTYPIGTIYSKASALGFSRACFAKTMNP